MAFIGNTYTTQGFVPAVDYFNGNGSTTAFTLSRPVGSVFSVQAVVENVPQKPNDAFTVSGNTITFTSAPPSGTQNIYVYYTSPITQVIAPSQGTVGPTALTAGAPSWSQAGGVTLPRIDSTNEGGQLNFNRSSDDTQVWAIDSFGSTSTPTLRFINGATVAVAFDGSNNVGIGTTSPSDKLHVVANATGQDGAIRVDSQFGSGYFGAVANYPAFGYRSGGVLTAALGYDTNNNFLFTGPASSRQPAFLCRAWVNFNGTGTVAIRASGNVSSITDLGTGTYRVNFTNAMPDANFVAFNGNGGSYSPVYSLAVGSVTVETYNFGSPPALSDRDPVLVAVFR